MQEMEKPRWKWPMQAWLQAMQARMSSVRPASAFRAMSGSAIMARVMPQRSAWPEAITCSAVCGWLMRPATNTGFDTTDFIALAKGATYAFSTIIGGTM